MKNIYDVSSRTRIKIIKRLNLSCFNCGWNKSKCDIHHIIPVSKNGTNDHKNLTILCPNCHRLAHDGILNEFKSIEDIIGDNWSDHYYGNKYNNTTEKAKLGNLASLKTRQINAKEKAKNLINKIKKSNIDFKKRGWKTRIEEQFSIKRQHVKKLFEKYDPEFLINCY